MRLDTSCTALENGRTGWSMVPRMKRWSHDGRPTEIQRHLAQVRGSATLAPMAHLGTVPLDPLVFYRSPHSFLRTTWFPYPNRRCFQLLTILPLFCLTITSWAPATLSFLYFYGDGFQPFFSLGSTVQFCYAHLYTPFPFAVTDVPVSALVYYPTLDAAAVMWQC